MQINDQNETPFTLRKITVNFYLFVVALYFYLAFAFLINILINLTVGSYVGLYFEFINASVDRSVVYFLHFMLMVYITAKSRKITVFSLYSAYIFASYFVFAQIADLLMILASFIVLAWFLTTPYPFSAMDRKKAVTFVLAYLISILVVVEFLALLCWFVFLFFPTLSQEGMCRYLVDLETKMFLLTGCLSPIFTILFLFAWIAKLPLSRSSSVLSRLRIILFNRGEKGSDNACLRKPFPVLLFTCVFALSFFVLAYPYMLRLNVAANPMGVDFPFYEEYLTAHAGGDFFSVLAKTFFKYPDRPLSLLILYFARCVSGLAASTIVQFSSIVLGVILVLATYFSMNAISGRRFMPLLAAFFSVSSFQIAVGLYGFFISNWMALIELYLLIGFYFGAVSRKSHLRMIIALLLSVSILFTHSWTWGMAIGVIFTYLVLMMLFSKEKTGDFRFEIKYLLVIILVNVLAGVARNYVLGRPAGYFETANLARETVSADALGAFWSDLLYVFLHTMYGFFVNPLALFLAFLGGFMVVLTDKPVNRYLTSWLLASCVFFVLGSGWVVKSRILFNLPLPIFEAIGLAGISNIIQKLFGPSRASKINILVILLVLLVNLNYAFRCLFTLSQI